MGAKRYYFYVLLCKDGTLYAGFTVDLAKRLATHNTGKGAKYTKLARRRPATLLYAEYFETKSQAMQAEARFKQLTRPAKEAYMSRNGVIVQPHQALVLVKGLQAGNLVEPRLNQNVEEAQSKGDHDATTNELSTAE